ncbi:hypothetical protein IL306_012512, partial [Fusarium sp. DS 682]
MSNSDVPSHDGSTTCFAFPDHITALTFFDSDLTDSVLLSDECSIRNDGESDDEFPVPSSYLIMFPVEPLLSPLPESKSTSTASKSPEASGSSQNGQPDRDTDSDESDPPIQHPDSDSSPPGSLSSGPDSDDNVCILACSPSPLQDRNRSNKPLKTQTIVPSTSKPKTEPFYEPESDLPTYHVHQLDWKHPVDARELRERSEQHNQEIKALFWDMNHIFRPTDVLGSAYYRKELREWRRLRGEYIMNEPTPQQQAQSEQLLLTLTDIVKKRNRFFRKRVQETGST